MHLQLSVDRAANGDIFQLHKWLASDPRIAGRASLSIPQADPASGAMGPLEVIDVVLGRSIDLCALIVACAAWREAKRNSATVTIERQGIRAEVTDAEPRSIEQITETIGSDCLPYEDMPDN
ncbi:hypothetical protein GCM10009557_15420 [Virgisporangium ochraceum]|uniref:Uncharacterized protein n=1 Tax=Virgisporangium ochraceum TaxID=65505 RepID=A0A8J3ZQJ2_9ACTN|nr:hypothetical protein [Virgisporangium ochraceum]GIJ67936.1 hypothetical protein Voc01_028530 [Virgisporangium ochraceum]